MPSGTGGPACGKPHGPYDDPGAPAGSITIAYNQLPSSLNPNTGHGNSTYNANMPYFMNSGLNYYDVDSNLINDDSFGTCTIESVDPLTVKYTIKDGVKWSDGVPVTAADLFLAWAASSGAYNNAEAAYDDDGNLLPSKGVAFDSSSQGLALVKDVPKISDDGKSLTLVYSKFFVDYSLALGVGVPAHVVAMHALKETDATKATADMMSVFTENTDFGKPSKDLDKLKAIADFWNTGFDMTQMPTDKSLLVSNGPYLMTNWVKDQYVTFEANPDYNWGPKPTIKTITYQLIADPTAAVQALQNGEVQIINPQATADVVKTVQGLEGQGIKGIFASVGIYEHIDFVFDNGGPFDPKTYGGGDAGAKKALAARQAFLLTIPRQDIVNRLIKPLNPDASVRNSFTFYPGQPGYDDSVKVNGSADVVAGDPDKDPADNSANIAKAKQLLADNGITGLKIRYMYADKNARRANEFKLVHDSAAKAGIDVIDGKNADWSSLLSNTKGYDASMFAWASTSTAVSGNADQFMCEDKAKGIAWGQNNFGHYCNQQVNDDLVKLLSEPDTQKQIDLLIDVDKNLWADGFGTVLYQFPDVTAYDSTKVTGVTDMLLSPNGFGNFWDWRLVGG